ncbi:hypothetical protein D9M69_651170 [compost metagenome]
MGERKLIAPIPYLNDIFINSPESTTFEIPLARKNMPITNDMVLTKKTLFIQIITFKSILSFLKRF